MVDRAPKNVAAVRVYTLGHSRHPIERFLDLVLGHGIALVIDTRGRPYSRFNPQFNHERLRAALGDKGVDYQWSGDRLSGRPEDRSFYDSDGRVLWDRLSRSSMVKDGLDEVVREAARRPTALLCAEEDPRRCHRRFLLTPPLVARGVEVHHIRADGRIEDEHELRRATGELDLRLD